MADLEAKAGTIDSASAEFDHARTLKETVRVQVGDSGAPNFTPVYEDQTTTWVYICTVDSMGRKHTTKHKFADHGTPADRAGANAVYQSILAAHKIAAYKAP